MIVENSIPCRSFGAELRWLKQLEDENYRLKHIAADLTLDIF